MQLPPPPPPPYLREAERAALSMLAHSEFIAAYNVPAQRDGAEVVRGRRLFGWIVILLRLSGGFSLCCCYGHVLLVWACVVLIAMVDLLHCARFLVCVVQRQPHRHGGLSPSGCDRSCDRKGGTA